MLLTYRFVSNTQAEVGNTQLKRFGQRVEMQESVARNIQLGGCALIPEADFNKLGFTTEDLKIWADPFMDPFEVPHILAEAQAKARFLARKQAAQEMFVKLRQRLTLERNNPTEQGEMPATAATTETED